MAANSLNRKSLRFRKVSAKTKLRDFVHFSLQFTIFKYFQLKTTNDQKINLLAVRLRQLFSISLRPIPHNKHQQSSRVTEPPSVKLQGCVHSCPGRAKSCYSAGRVQEP